VSNKQRLHPPKHFALQRKDCYMQTNQAKTTNYMQELDKWTEQEIIDVLSYALLKGPDEAVELAESVVKKAIREKVLESYHNGQAAKTSQTSKRPVYEKH
jgi:hypothetical protein